MVSESGDRQKMARLARSTLSDLAGMVGMGKVRWVSAR